MGSHHDNFSSGTPNCTGGMPPIWAAPGCGGRLAEGGAKKTACASASPEHLGASFYLVSEQPFAQIRKGPKAGVPYDGADPQYQDLYHFPAEPGDTGWYSNNPRWQQQWYNEIKELVDNYHPDLLYSDGGVPFGNEVGRSMIAHFYNSSAARHGGKVEASTTANSPPKAAGGGPGARHHAEDRPQSLADRYLPSGTGSTTATGSSAR